MYIFFLRYNGQPRYHAGHTQIYVHVHPKWPIDQIHTVMTKWPTNTFSGTSLLWTPLGQESCPNQRCEVDLYTKVRTYTIGTSEAVLIREVSLFQRRPLREVPFFSLFSFLLFSATYVRTFVRTRYTYVAELTVRAKIECPKGKQR